MHKFSAQPFFFAWALFSFKTFSTNRKNVDTLKLFVSHRVSTVYSGFRWVLDLSGVLPFYAWCNDALQGSLTLEKMDEKRFVKSRVHTHHYKVIFKFCSQFLTPDYFFFSIHRNLRHIHNWQTLYCSASYSTPQKYMRVSMVETISFRPFSAPAANVGSLYCAMF